MSPRRFLPALLLLAACGDEPGATDTIAAKVRETPELSQLEQALDDTGVMTSLADGDASLTLFAPTDDAIAMFLDTNDADLDNLLRDALRYHVVDGERTIDELAAARDVESIEGHPIAIDADLAGLLLNDDVRLVAEPIEASNGVIYRIDSVLARPTTTTYRSEPAVPFDTFEIADSITIDAPGYVRRLEVSLDIDHSEVYMLQVGLRNETTGEELTLVANPPSYADDIKTTLSDRAPLDVQDDVVWSVDADPAYPEAAYRPYQPLRFAYGQPASGTWTLVVYNYYGVFEDSWFNAWSLDVTTTEERPDPTLAIARPRGFTGVAPHGFDETLDLVVKRLAGLTGPIEVTLDGGDAIVSEPFVLDGDGMVAHVAFTAAPDAADGPIVLRVDATAGRPRRVVGFDGAVVTPDAVGVEMLSQISLADLGAPGGRGNDSWGWTDPQSGKEYALVGTSQGTSFVDISTPDDPRVLGFLPTHTEESLWRDIKVYEDHAFIVSEALGHGLQVFDLTQLRDVTTFQTFTETAHLAAFGNAHNLVINEATGFAYAVGATEEIDGGEPLCGGGLLVVDITTPSAPTYAGCFGGGVPVGATPGPEFPSNKYTHDAQCVVYAGPDVTYQGHEICVTSDGDSDGQGNTVGIADLTIKATPVQLSRLGYEGAGYTHQGWLTEDHQYFLMGDEFDEFDGVNTRTYVFDVRDLDAPVLVGAFDNPRDAVGHNMYTHGGLAYQANYTSGLRIVDLANVATASMIEVAYFDTYPEDDGFDDGTARARPHPGLPPIRQQATFEGAWSNYPYFASGSIVVSDMKRGLFVVRRTP